jgi:Cof subfamily protein (haloacid dehalogenase superfamily)
MNHSFPYKLAAIDIDDTLVGPDKRISEANRAAVQRLTELGCRVVLASGRRHDNMLAFARELGVSDYLISSGGAVARHMVTGELLHEAVLPVPDAPEVVAEGLERGLTVLYWSADGVFARQPSRWVQQYEADCRDAVTLLDVESLAGQGTPPAEKIVWGAEPEIIAALAPVMRERYGDRMIVTVTDDWFVEFAAPGADKAAGVAVVAARYGIDRRHVLAFGDGNNDVPLLTWAGLGVAMSHGRPAAHAAARLVSPTGDPETELARAIGAVLARTGVHVRDEDAVREVVEAA